MPTHTKANNAVARKRCSKHCDTRSLRVALVVSVLFVSLPAIAEDQTVSFSSTDMHAAYCNEILNSEISVLSSIVGTAPASPGSNASDDRKKIYAKSYVQWATAKQRLDSTLTPMKSNAAQLRLFILSRLSVNSDASIAFLTGQKMAEADFALLNTAIPESCYLNGETQKSGIPASDIDRFMKCSNDARRPSAESVAGKLKSCLNIGWLF